MFEGIVWVSAPRAEQRIRPRIIVPAEGKPLRGVCLSEDIVGVQTHWANGRTDPCTELADGGCSRCSRGIPRRWKGYLAVHPGGNSPVEIWQLTAWCWQSFVESHPGHFPLRGFGVQLLRQGKGKHGRMTLLAEDAPIAGAANLPAAPEIENLLMQVWLGKRGAY